MAINSTLKKHATTASAHYLRNQPKYQRALMTAFSFYVLISTYQGLSPRKKSKKVNIVNNNNSGVVGGVGESNKDSVIIDEKVTSGKGGKKRKRAPRVEVSLMIDYSTFFF